MSYSEPASADVRLGLMNGLRYPFRGARFVYVEHRSLAKFWVPPIVITACALSAVTWGAIEWHDALLQWLWPEPTGEGTWTSIVRALHAVAGWLLTLVLLITGAIAVSLISSVIAAPFNDALSEAVERIRTGASGPPFELSRLLGDLGRTVGLELLKLGLYLSLMGPLFVVSWLVPGVGTAVYMFVGFFLTCMFFAVDYVDWPASRRGLPLGSRMHFARRHAGAMLGLGMGVWVLLYVPLLNLFFMPAAVAGGTLMFLDAYGTGPIQPASVPTSAPR